jgi:hypothetical protein
VWSASHSAAAARRIGTKYKKSVEPVTAFQVITGGALQKIGEFDNADEASAAAGIPGRLHKNGSVQREGGNVVRVQLTRPSKKPSKPTASSSGGSFYFIYTYQVEYDTTDVDIKAKLALRGNAAAKQELKDRAPAAKQSSWYVKLKDRAEGPTI